MKDQELSIAFLYKKFQIFKVAFFEFFVIKTLI
jgi:hypothetical protein